MQKEDLARLLDGGKYPFELPKELAAAAKQHGLVVVYGASDDLLELRGAISEEYSAYEGTEILVTPIGVWDDDACRDKCVYFRLAKQQAKEQGQLIKALWDPGDGYSWRYETAIPHATFEIVEDGEPYCRGIVFALADAATKQES